MPENPQIYFGVFELDLKTAQLRKRGVRMKLQRQPFEVLAMLVGRNGAPVSREELQQRLWPANTFVDFEHAIGSAIFKLRAVLGDEAANPRFIETLSNRSYRFIAPLRTAATAKSAISKMRLAVLPFLNIGGDSAHSYFVDGVTNELIHQLGRMNPQRLGVIARTSAMAYRSTEKPLSEIGRELNVEYILEGSIQQDGNRLRIMAQLVQLPDETPMWTETYDHPRKKVLDTQIKVAQRIAEALTLELLPQQLDLVRRSLPHHAEAYDLYLRGRHLWSKRTESAIREAISYFQRAIARDPQYAMAYVGLADVYAVLGYYGMIPSREAFTAARDASEAALKVDEELAEALSTLAFSILQYDWNWQEAEKHHRAALEINPNCASGYHWYGIDLTQVGLLEEAVAMLERAQSIDPLSVPIIAHIGRSYYFSRNYTCAIETLKRAIEMDPEYAPAHSFLGLALLEAGCKADAITTLEAGAKLSGDHPALISGLAHALYRCGKKAQAERVANSLRDGTKRMVSPYFHAFARAADPKQRMNVLTLLEAAYDHRFGWLMYLKFDPSFDSMRDDPAFATFLNKIRTRPAAANA